MDRSFFSILFFFKTKKKNSKYHNRMYSDPLFTLKNIQQRE